MTNRNTDPRGSIRLAVLVLLAAMFGISWLAAAEFHILGVNLQNGNQLTISYAAEAGAAYELLQGNSVTNITTAFATNTASVSGTAQFNLSTTASSTFFRIKQTEVAAPSLTAIRETSPVDGESGVSVTRETIVRFSAPLAENTTLSSNNFYAGFGGRRLLSRLELASDRRTATLFYLEPIPGSTRIYAVFDGFGLLDFMGRPLDADGDGQPGGLVPIGFDTYSTTPVSGTAVIGRVFASDLMPGPDTGNNAINRALEGVIITVDGAEQELRAVTDAQGNFTLTNSPAGRFFVHIDGRTATNGLANAGLRWDQRAYYPVVGKAWQAAAGRTDNLAGGTGLIYLPLIAPGTLQPVSMTTNTPITFPPSVIDKNPALAGVTLTVPANSLFSDDGTRGGRVGIAPVPPDRLPSPLPPGLELPIVITVQTDGPFNFDRPAPVCFPNLPDPVLKTPLPAGSKQALISFNHKKGIWEAVGSMTVSADGKMICTDPGVGILQPGWHGVGPEPDGPPPPPRSDPPCEVLDLGTCLDYCEITASDKRRRVVTAYDECDSILFGTEATYERCLERATRSYDREMLEIEKKYEDCVSRCDMRCRSPHSAASPSNIEPTGRVQSASIRNSVVSMVAQANDPIAIELARITQQMADLIRPFASSFAPIPTNVVKQVQDLRQQAGSTAGSGVAEYVRVRAIAFEDGLAAMARARGLEPEDLDPGNAPPYPVLYAATVARPSGLFVLRGETGPFGQYSLFVPRDGSLLDVSFFDPKTKEFGVITPNLSPKATYRLPRFTLPPFASNAPDFDKDGLPDLVEDVLGTDPEKADTDGDGILDGAEVDQGTNPLDGQPVRTGVHGTAKTPGSAVDVAAANDLLAVAEGASGVSIFNIFDGMKPVLVAHVDTPGTAQAVAISGNFVVVADREQGLEVIDVSEPAQARIVRQVRTDGNAQAVAVAGNRAYVGLSTRSSEKPGAVALVDLITGTVLDQVSFAEFFNDLAVNGEELYVLTSQSLQIYGAANGRLELLGQLAVAGDASPLEIGRKLFVGDGLAYVGHFTGYSIVDVRNPAVPVLVGSPPSTQLAVHDLTTTGSGLLLATTSFAGAQTLAVSLYDVLQPTNVTKFLTSFDTPGDARAVTIYKGLAYVADSGAGIQVINYLPYDGQGKPPTIVLSTSATNRTIEAGRLMRVTAKANDDIQVRNVEFYVDGVKAFSDGNFPFEYRFDVPALTAVKTNFTIRARALDTGGNSTWSEELSMGLLPDVTPPRILAAAPLGGARVLSSVSAYFSEPMNTATLTAASFRLIEAGADGLFDTTDDLPVIGGVLTYHAENARASLDFATPLQDGIYRAIVMAAVTDQAGNRLGTDYTWQLRVANAVFWSRGMDGWWGNGFNWSTGAAPGPSDDVFIESIPGDVTITHVFGTEASVKSLFVGERLTIVGATLQVAGSVQLQKPLTLLGGTLQGGIVTENGEGKLTFTSHPANTLDGVTLNGDLELTTAGAQVLIRNGLTINGRVLLDGGSIRFTGNQTFNTGQVIFAGNSGSLVSEGDTTLGPALVVRGGTGFVKSTAFGKLINQGLISADAGGTLTINPSTPFENRGTIESRNGGSVSLISGGFRNTGQINASGGGGLTLDGPWSNSGTITASEVTVNLGGTFALADLATFNRTGGTVNFSGVLDLGGGTLALEGTNGSWRMTGGTFKGGTLKQTDGAKLLFVTPNSQNTFDGMRVEGDLELTSTGALALIRNGLSLAGSAVLDNTGAITFVGDQTFTTGQIVFAGISGVMGIDPGTTLTLGLAVVVRGNTGLIGSGGFGGARKLINHGLISADVAGGTLTITPTEFENIGTIAADAANSTVIIRADSFTDTGTIRQQNGGKVLIN